MVICIAMILAVIFALVEKLDANIHKLERKLQESKGISVEN
jgi:hypothetical protein